MQFAEFETAPGYHEAAFGRIALVEEGLARTAMHGMTTFQDGGFVLILQAFEKVERIVHIHMRRHFAPGVSMAVCGVGSRIDGGAPPVGDI
jgi:hypothetical protein